jgi:hypothetical protein
MKTKTINLYFFDELSDEAKEKVLDNERYINVDGDFWFDYDGKTGFSSKEIKKYHLNPKECDNLLTYKTLYFDLDRNNYIQFVDCRFAHPETAMKFLGVPKNLWNSDRVEWSFENKNYGGNCSATTKLCYDNIGEEEFTAKEIEILDNAVSRFDDKMQEALSDLRKNYQYLTSDEAIIETIEANEYTFTEDGVMEN